MKFVTLAAIGVAAAFVAMPSQAWALYCTSSGPSAGYVSTYDNGERVLVPDVEAQAEMDLTRLRQLGVAATSVERWNGCLRAFVQQADGSQSMEFYEPGSLRRVQ